VALAVLLGTAFFLMASSFRPVADENGARPIDRSGNSGSAQGPLDPSPDDDPLGTIEAPSIAWVESKETALPVGTVTVPAIGLQAKFRLGVNDEVVQFGPGLWPGTPFPGDAGNAVLAGHRTTYTHPFLDLDLLEIGDVVRTRVTGLRGSTSFKVSRITVVPEHRYVDFVLRQPRQPDARMITLFACTPKGSRTHRIVVQAQSVKT